MKFPDIRKYFFINAAAIWSYVVVAMLIIYRNADLSTGILPIGYNFLFLLCLVVLAIPEIIIRKDTTKKIFPEFKLNLKLPRIIEILYTIIFYTGLFMASFMILYVLWKFICNYK